MNGIPNNPEMGVLQILLVLRRRKWIILAMMLLCAGAGFAFAKLQVPRYETEAVLQFDIRGQKIVNIESVVASMPTDEAALKTELDVIESRDLMQRVAEKLELAKVEQFRPLEQESNPLFSTMLVNNLLKKLRVSHAPQSYTARVGFSASDPQLAAKVANAVVDEYMRSRQANRVGATETANSWLNERIQELKAKVHESEQAVQKFQEDHNLIRLVGGATVSDKQLEEINLQLVDAQSSRAQAQARLQQAQSQLKKSGGAMNLDSIPDVLKSELIQALKVKATEVTQRRSELATRYGAKHPQMIKVNNEIKDIYARIYDEVSKVVLGLEHELEVERIKEQSLSDSLKKLKGDMAAGTRDEVQLAELLREKETNVTLYNEFLSRYKETSHDPEQTRQEVQVISYAAVPTSPAWPKKKLLLGAGLVLGAMLGVTLAFVLEHLDKGFRNLKHLEQVTGVSVLGMVPHIQSKKVPVTEYVLHRPTSIFAESLRTIITGVRFSNPDQQPKVLMVTSSIPEEGKSVFSVSLARLMARSGSKVLLVDCDMRVPTVHKAFAEKPAMGLEDIIMEGKTLQEVVAVDAQTGLHFVRTSGTVTHSQEMLGSNKMKEFVAQARTNYDLVILDSPPLMAISDALVLSKIVDTTVLLARWETTPRETTLSALKALKSAQARLAGVVLSRVDIKKFERYHYNEGSVEYRKYHHYHKN